MKDVLQSLQDVGKCRRCNCASCINGYENHDHFCTDGPHCVETREKLRSWRVQVSHTANRAVTEIRKLRQRVQQLTVDNGLGDGI